MSDPTVTLIVSDLHVGGGSADKGDDHIYQKAQLARFLHEQAATPEGRGGRLELYFNGDFLEFAQTNQAAFSLASDRYWCSQEESLAKLETIIAGHADIFGELERFQHAGNRVTIAAGNHDVDLYWPQVQQRLRQVAGANLRFELGHEWVARHGGKLQIGHGHMSDPANHFEHWGDPVLTADWGVQRLEMCPGTLFMVKFVNKLEAQYPFADNLLPVTKLASVLLRDDKSGFASVGWVFASFVGGSPLSVLQSGAPEDYGDRLLTKINTDPNFRAQLKSALASAELNEALVRFNASAPSKQLLALVMFDLLGRIDDATWSALFEMARPPTLGTDDVTLSAIVRASFDDGKLKQRSVAQHRIDAITEASVVVMGHTHQPDEVRLEGGMYYNPGCWTRYLELKASDRVTLEDLKDESCYPYQLNYVRVEANDSDVLKSAMVCFDRG